MEAFSELAGIEATSQPTCDHARGEDPPYQYSPIENEKGTMRLLILRGGAGNEIHCELVNSTIDDHALPFEAVSYTWGPEFRANSIRVGGKMMSVTFHLSLILRDLRRRDADRVIWVDAVCINQQDAIEKGNQVAQMKQIYKSAKCVLFCICRPTDYNNLLIDSLWQLENHLRRTMSFDSQVLDASWRYVQSATACRQLDPKSRDFDESMQRQIKALTTLQSQGLEYILSQPWFHRVWILQEVANATNAIVYCGNKSVSAAIFALSPKLLDAKIRSGDDGFVAEVFSLMPGPSRRDAFQDLYSLLQRFRGSQATVERDRIYALFGICQDVHIDTKLNPDYVDSERDVVLDTISYICQMDKSAVEDSHFDSISDLLVELDHLDNDVLSHLLRSNNYSAALSLLRYRGEYVSVTEEIVNLASTDVMIKEGIMALLLQQRNADTIMSDWRGWMPLWVASENGHDLLAKSMLEKVDDLDSVRDEYGQETRLFLSAKDGNTCLVNLLLEAGANPEVCDRGHRSSLSCAAEHGHIAIVRLLIDNGADVNFYNQNDTPLSYAAGGGHEANFNLLLKKGADLLHGGDTDGRASLCRAAGNGHEAMVRLILAKGVRADYGGLGTAYYTPLGHAAIGCHPSILSLLFDSGATAGEHQLSVMLLDVAIRCWYSPISGHDPEERHKQELSIRILLEKGAQCRNALCWAASLGSETIVQILLEHGLDESTINGMFSCGIPDGPLDRVKATALTFATQTGNKNLVKLLLAYGANPNIRDSEGKTPLSRAEDAGHREIVDILRSEGVEM